MSPRLVIGIAAFIWIFIKLPQEWWIHVAQLDATDVIKESSSACTPETSWGEAMANRPWVVVLIVAVIGLLAYGAWWLLTRRLPPADHPLTFDADVPPTPVDPAAIDRERRRLAERLFDRELLEKIALVSLISIIFGRMLPGVDATPLAVIVGVALVIVANTIISEAMIRRGTAWATMVRQFAAMLVVNIAIVLVGRFIFEAVSDRQLEHALVFVLLLTLIVTLYDRYRPIHLARFAA